MSRQYTIFSEDVSGKFLFQITCFETNAGNGALAPTGKLFNLLQLCTMTLFPKALKPEESITEAVFGVPFD